MPSKQSPNTFVVGGRQVAVAAAAYGALRRLYITPAAEAWAQAADLHAQSEVCPVATLKSQFGAELHQGVICEVKAPEPVSVEQLVAACLDAGGPLVVLEEVQDPQNLGSVLRACAGFGASGVVLGKQRSATMSAAVLRASVGYAFAVPYAVVGGIPNFLLQKATDLPRYAAVAEAGHSPAALDLAGPCVFVMGNEGAGLKPLTMKRCTEMLEIPLSAAESLNVAQATTVLLYEAQRQRLCLPGSTGV